MTAANKSTTCLLILAVATLLAVNISYGQKVPTKVLYNGETLISDISSAASVGSLENVQVLVIDNSKLIVGKKETVMSYDLDLSSPPITETTFPLVEPAAPSAFPCATVTTNDRCFTFINVIQFDLSSSKWYICGTSGINPQCWICASLACTSMELMNGITVEGLVTAVMGTDQPFLITDDNKVFGAAAKEANTDTTHAITRADLSDFSNRVDTPDNVIQDAATDFVGEPIEYNEHVYYFFREIADEYKNFDKIMYSRVARICKADAGGGAGSQLPMEFTTFQKARLNCSVSGEYPSNYDYIQDIYRSPRNLNIIYAVFTDTPIMNRANSAICVYHIDEIVAVFDDSSFKGQTGITSLWLPYASADVPTPRPGTCDAPQPQANYVFIMNNPLMNQPIPSIQIYVPGTAGDYDRDSASPLMLLDGLYITQLVVDEAAAGTEFDVFFLGSKNGKVYKAYVYGAGTANMQTRIIQEVNLGSENSEVLSMTLHSGMVYVGTTNSLHKIPVACCDVFQTEIECVLSQSPYCSWDEDASTCEANTVGSQCLMNDVYSCGQWPEAECFSPKTAETESCTKPIPECQPCCDAGTCDVSATPSCNPLDCPADTYVRVTSSAMDSESIVLLSAFVRAPPESIWGTTDFVCDCGCPPVDMKEITATSTDDGMEYLLGRYSFDMSSCPTKGDITLTFKANGQDLEEKTTIDVDQNALITDGAVKNSVRTLDEDMDSYDYQVCWWKTHKSTLPLRNANDVWCYNCPTT